MGSRMQRSTLTLHHPAPRTSHLATHKADAALVIFGKAPIPGQVKTRLCPPLTQDEAATLQGSLVLDVVERSRSIEKAARLDRFMACAPSCEHVFFKILQERQGVRLIDQVGEDLGQRMDQAFKEVFALGYKRVLLVGTDVPTLPASSYGQALSLLSDHDLVLGPSLDGGYYLLGLKKPASALFTDIPWSTDRVCSLTKAKAESLRLRIGLLPTCRDLDTIDDLLALAPLAASKKGQEQSGGLSSRTAGVIQMLASRLKSRMAERS